MMKRDELNSENAGQTAWRNEKNDIRTALVSTNSITQGEQVPILWKPLFEQGVHINFAHRTFRWDSEASLKAHVHCVIIGFGYEDKHEKFIFSNDRKQIAKNINPYLINAPDVFIESRNIAICNIPKIGIGNKPIDDGNYLFTKDEMNNFVEKEPKSKKYFKKWYGANEFINNNPRYCLWLGDCSPNELRTMPVCLKLVQNVKYFRLKSKSEGTRKLAGKPTRFHVENMPESDYILIPRVSSENRRYVPMGFLNSDTIASDSALIISNATLYHFGILTSNVHMAWMRAVCGRLEMRYRYSKDIVYNNFPWCEPTDVQKDKIEKTAQGILDARDLYPDCSLADLYYELTMPSELRKAHQENDKAVMEAYGFKKKDENGKTKWLTEPETVARLMEMYKKLTAEK